MSEEASSVAAMETIEALRAATRQWRDRIELDDGTERRPVFVFSYGFPTRA
jgi:hypothetical protein